ncbi:MAG: PSD1 and planctomycete cytochrome C domain-containing protein [Planctomycetota bacterium]|nr:PSD1 and planctomycete cytochrome C domain-containing protein [Planctomycetota bacterium]
MENPEDFFEKKIRPVLVEHCYRCHAPGKRGEKGKRRPKGGLRLDRRDGWMRGGESGPAIVPGDPDASLLIRALRHDDPDLQMPPKKKLSDEVIADFERWVRLGAPDPRTGSAAAGPVPVPVVVVDFESARRHWAFRPLRRPVVPTVRDALRARTPIDRFVAARLEAAGLGLSPQADRRTLVRRVFYDVVGLPPRPEEVDAFERDDSPDAFARLVDRLLASPHHGERWGRHWLDVARYADTKDLVLVLGKDAIRPYAYTYRDYVIRAFNEDLSYDRFILEQLAADRIKPDVEPWKLAAMGFLTLGRLFDNNPQDIFADQIDTVSRGFLGLTVSCARCHDHKYDAIPTEDYYSLYGVFANSVRPLERPLIDDPSKTPGSAEFEKKAAAIRKALRDHIDSQYRHITETARQRTTDYLLRVATSKPDPLETAVFFMSLSPEDLRPRLVFRWRAYIEKHARPGHPVFGPWSELTNLAGLSDPSDPSDGELASRAAEILARCRSLPSGTGDGQLNPLVAEKLDQERPRSRADVARAYGELLQEVYAQSTSKDAAPLRERFPEAFDQLLEGLTGKEGPLYFPRQNTYLHMSRVPRGTYHGKLLELDKLAVNSPGAPPRAMVLVDAPEIQEPRVFVRGNPLNAGDRVPRRFLRLLGGDDPAPFSGGSGRLDLARAITSPDNPLTSRVLVNRVWMHHFGEPLVDTPSDFGTRSTPPSHPQLLDYLAWTFVFEDGWSLKRLHRRILLSSVYQQSSRERAAGREVDPDNRLLWRAHRRRLEFEPMRDTLLAVSGRLDRKLHGRPVDVAGDPQVRRRTVYGLVDRQNLPGLFRAFDFASPDQSAARRPRTTVPQQALFAMNSPFVIEQARALAARREVADEKDPARRVAALYRLALVRAPHRDEVDAALRFVDEAARNEGEAKLDAWEQYAQILLSTNELLFID